MKRCIAVRRILCLCLMLVAFTACNSYAERENFLIYFSGGPAFPTEDDILEAGWGVSGGFSFVLAWNPEYCLELGARADWYRFSKETYLTQYYPQYNVGHENHNTFDLEMRFRRNMSRFFNPYGVFGLALYELNNTVTLGFGNDLGTGPEGKRLVFCEFRYIPDPYGIIRLHVGIRLG